MIDLGLVGRPAVVSGAAYIPGRAAASRSGMTVTGVGAWQPFDQAGVLPTGFLSHAAWLHAATEYAVRSSRPVRAVLVADATRAGGLSSAQALAQLARRADQLPHRQVIGRPRALEADREHIDR